MNKIHSLCLMLCFSSFLNLATPKLGTAETFEEFVGGMVGNMVGAGAIDALCEQAEKNNIRGMTNVLTYGVNVNTHCSSGHTPLTAATYKGNLAAMEFLVQKGANINLTHREEGATPLVFAYDYPKALEFLLKKKANINHTFDRGYTTLMAASMAGNVESVKLLLKYKANVNLKNNKGETALSLAKNDTIRNLLKNAGAK